MSFKPLLGLTGKAGQMLNDYVYPPEASPFMPSAQAAETPFEDAQEPIVPPPQEKPEPSISRLEALLKPTRPRTTTLNFGTDHPENSLQGLKDAQEQRDKAALVNNLGRAAELVGSGISRSKPVAQDIFKEQAQNAGHYVQDFKEQEAQRHEQEKSDPNSAISKNYKEIMKRFGVNIKGDASAEMLEKVAPWLEKAYMADEARQARKEQLALGMNNKHELELDKQVAKLKDDLDPNKARGGNLAFNQKKVDQADRLMALGNNVATGGVNNLDSRQIEELAIGLNSMLSSNVGSVEQVKALIPHTIVGNAAKLKEWLLNEPTGTHQIEFVKRMMDTVERERQVASDQVKKAQVSRLSAYNKFKKERPEDYNAALEAYDIDPSQINEKGQYVPKTEMLKKNTPSKPGTTGTQGKVVVKKGYNPTTNQTQFIYSDGTKEIVSGRQ